MNIQEWRDLAPHLAQMARDLSQCATELERWQWVRRAERLRLEAWSVGIHPRSTENDRAKMLRAKSALDAAFDSVKHLAIMTKDEVTA